MKKKHIGIVFDIFVFPASFLILLLDSKLAKLITLISLIGFQQMIIIKNIKAV